MNHFIYGKGRRIKAQQLIHRLFINLADIALFIYLILVLAALILLVILTAIDLRVRLLPNKYVFPFGLLGLVFHSLTHFDILSLADILTGAAIGYGLLWSIRYAANLYYKQDSLGLGDVKLMSMAGLWLGFEGVLFALTIGAFAGTLHGIGLALYRAARDKKKPNFHRLTLPAGPGFIVGIVAVGGWLFFPFFKEIAYGFGA